MADAAGLMAGAAVAPAEPPHAAATSPQPAHTRPSSSASPDASRRKPLGALSRREFLTDLVSLGPPSQECLAAVFSHGADVPCAPQIVFLKGSGQRGLVQEGGEELQLPAAALPRRRRTIPAWWRASGGVDSWRALTQRRVTFNSE